MVLSLENLSLSDMLVDGLEPFLDVLVLVLVEILQLLRPVRFFVEGDGTVAISLPRGIGAYEIYLTIGLELSRELKGIVVARVVGGMILDVDTGCGGMTGNGITLGDRGFESSTCSPLCSSD